MANRLRIIKNISKWQKEINKNTFMYFRYLVVKFCVCVLTSRVSVVSIGDEDVSIEVVRKKIRRIKKHLPISNMQYKGLCL